LSACLIYLMSQQARVETYALGFPLLSSHRSNSHRDQDDSHWGFTDTLDVFLEASICFQESFASSLYFQELPRQYQDYSSLYWALGLSSEELGCEEF